VVRSDQGGRFWILTPCGVCQERLFAYGPAVQVGVPHPEEPERWRSMRLDEVQPRTGGPRCSPATRQTPDQLRSDDLPQRIERESCDVRRRSAIGLRNTETMFVPGLHSLRACP
jgi:hypothetical protein